MSGKQGKEIRGSVRLGPTLSVARSDELFRLRVSATDYDIIVDGYHGRPRSR